MAGGCGNNISVPLAIASGNSTAFDSNQEQKTGKVKQEDGKIPRNRIVQCSGRSGSLTQRSIHSMSASSASECHVLSFSEDRNQEKEMGKMGQGRVRRNRISRTSVFLKLTIVILYLGKDHIMET